MFGIDFDGDGKDGMLDDMIFVELMSEDENSDDSDDENDLQALYGLHRGKQMKEQQEEKNKENKKHVPVKRSRYHIDGDGGFIRHILRKQHGGSPEQRPDIQIRHPPGGEAVIKAAEHYEGENRIQRLCAEHNRVGDNKHGEKVHVRQQLGEQLGAEHYCAEQ